MFHPAGGVIPVGAQAEVAAGLDDVTIDCMVNLPLLWWAWKVTGEERFLKVAVSHADRTAGWHVKEDGRIIQSVHFDLETGTRTREETHQGSGTQGCWTRGQAWGVYGFAAAYRATGQERFLEVADRAATYYFQRAGADLVPFYCFNDPAIPQAPRDSSAAAITSAGLWIMAEHAQGPALRHIAGTGRRHCFRS
jgi:unsaturated chondroitin disaccharide hydrolase